MSRRDFINTAELLTGQTWIYAKTMPHNPHEYTLRKNWSNASDFDYVVQYIRDHGYDNFYQGKSYRYLDINGFMYWTMGAPINKTILINRKTIQYKTPYDAIAMQYDQLFTDANSIEQNTIVMNMIGDVSTKSVLDIGCGTGLFLQYNKPGRYAGIDVSSNMLAQLITTYPEYVSSVINTSLSSFATKDKYDVIIALFGAASYLSVDELSYIKHLLSTDGKAFMMFYSPGYTPVTYSKTGITERQKSSPDSITGFTIPFGNYTIKVINHEQSKNLF